MGQQIPTFQAQPQFSESVTLGSAQYQLVFTWRDRLPAWYLDIYTLDGTAILTGRRVSPGHDLLFGGRAALTMAGHLFVRGSDPYLREMLGTRVVPVFYLDSEIPSPPAPAGLTIAVYP